MERNIKCIDLDSSELDLNEIFGVEYIPTLNDVLKLNDSTYGTQTSVQAIFSTDFSLQQISDFLDSSEISHIIPVTSSTVQTFGPLICHKVTSFTHLRALNSSGTVIIEIDLSVVNTAEYVHICKLAALKKFYVGNGIYRSCFVPHSVDATPPAVAVAVALAPAPAPATVDHRCGFDWKKVAFEVFKFSAAAFLGFLAASSKKNIKIEPRINVHGGSGPVSMTFLPIKLKFFKELPKIDTALLLDNCD